MAPPESLRTFQNKFHPPFFISMFPSKPTRQSRQRARVNLAVIFLNVTLLAAQIAVIELRWDPLVPIKKYPPPTGRDSTHPPDSMDASLYQRLTTSDVKRWCPVSRRDGFNGATEGSQAFIRVVDDPAQQNDAFLMRSLIRVPDDFELIWWKTSLL